MKLTASCTMPSPVCGGSLSTVAPLPSLAYDAHGNSTVLADQVLGKADDAGARVGVRSAFDPFGQPITPDTGDIGTTTADDAILDTTPGDADLAFVGGHGMLYEHGGSIATVETGARQYVAALGRFLEVDPVEGGVSYWDLMPFEARPNRCAGFTA